MPEAHQHLSRGHRPEDTPDRRRHPLRALLSWRAAREIALTVGAIAGVLCLLSAAASIAFDIRPVVFQSGSMSPAIPTGALAISQTEKAADLRIGDVVTVRTASGIRVTHRVQTVTMNGDTASLQLRGDANSRPDDQLYTVTSAPKVLFDVPKAGYAIAFLSGPVGIFAGGLLVGVVLLTLFGPGGKRPRSGGSRRSEGDAPRAERQRKRAGGARKAVLTVSTVAVGAIVASTLSGSATQAYYQDSASISSGTFTRPAVKPNAPGGIGCSSGSNSAPAFTISWAKVTGATSYVITYTPVGIPLRRQTFAVEVGGDATSSTYTFTGTQVGLYRATVQAKNSAGLSPASAGATTIVANVDGVISLTACILL